MAKKKTKDQLIFEGGYTTGVNDALASGERPDELVADGAWVIWNKAPQEAR